MGSLLTSLYSHNDTAPFWRFIRHTDNKSLPTTKRKSPAAASLALHGAHDAGAFLFSKLHSETCPFVSLIRHTDKLPLVMPPLKFAAEAACATQNKRGIANFAICMLNSPT